MKQQIVYRPTKLDNGRYIIEQRKTFLFFHWWSPLPWLYSEEDELIVHIKHLKSQIKIAESNLKSIKAKNDSFVKSAIQSWHMFISGKNPKGLSKHYAYAELASLGDQASNDSPPSPKRGKPEVLVFNGADKPAGNNQSSNQRDRKGNPNKE